MERNLPHHFPPNALSEDTQSKLPAIQLLINAGYKYLTPKEANNARNNRTGNVILENILISWLRTNNTFHFKNQNHHFSENNIENAVQKLKYVDPRGVMQTNDDVLENYLYTGVSLSQTVDGHSKSFTLNYIDWENPKNNRFHITEEFTVQRANGKSVSIPDIVLFVNGIPFGVIENKAPHVELLKGITQLQKYQNDDNIPTLFYYAQILAAVNSDEAKYATTDTKTNFWAVWKEDNIDHKIEKLINQPLPFDTVEQIYTVGERPQMHTNQGLVRNKKEERKITKQDRLLYSVFRPERLLELTRSFILFEHKTKIIARYQQYRCVKKLQTRIRKRDKDGRRKGGVVWHTQGSGKSLTMVMLAKHIALTTDNSNYKIILVTDRVNLDTQITKTFRRCKREVHHAASGKDLAHQIMTPGTQIITTILDKFEFAVNKYNARSEDSNIYVLVDEGHRSQHGFRHANMRRALPNACYIGFTGTPLMKKEKSTANKFGGIIDTYNIREAVKDKAVVPLLYEGRNVPQIVNPPIDKWFERITETLSPQEAEDLKRKFATTGQLNKAGQKVEAIAWDISEHFQKNFQGSEYKGQLVTPDKATAIRYKRLLDQIGIVSSEVLISPPTEPEGDENRAQKEESETYKSIQAFWKEMMQQHRNKESIYNNEIIDDFKKLDHPEIIIVVDKLLTGFDAPRNTVLYLTRNLKDHTLLQAIARVNRLYEGKDFGYILDYYGVLENLDHALDLYAALPDYDQDELFGTLTDIGHEVSQLPQKHNALWSIFKEVKNKNDTEAMCVHLNDEKRRHDFYDRLSAFARALGIAMSSYRFLEETPARRIDMYKNDLKEFMKLRIAVRRRYSEAVNFGDYEPRIKKLMDTHVGAGEVEQITPLTNIFNKEEFDAEVEKMQGTAARADTIATRTAKAIEKEMGKDPVFFMKFSQMLEDAIQAYRENRINAAQYLEAVNDVRESVINRTGDQIPPKLQDHDAAKAFYGIFKENMPKPENTEPFETQLPDIALLVENVIDKHRIVNWVNNEDVENKMEQGIDDILYDFTNGHGLTVDTKLLYDIIDQCLSVARQVKK